MLKQELQDSLGLYSIEPIKILIARFDNSISQAILLHDLGQGLCGGSTFFEIVQFLFCQLQIFPIAEIFDDGFLEERALGAPRRLFKPFQPHLDLRWQV
jgi:hypothetical protein